jgi:mannose-6-phosphate isomerase-like protein (cupin superfamily)
VNWFNRLFTFVSAAAQNPPGGQKPSPAVGAALHSQLHSQVFVFEKLPVHAMPTVDSRALIGGQTVDGCAFSTHESSLHPGCEPHPPHHHTGEEMFMVLEGTLRVTINGVSSLVTKGSVAFVGSGDEHGIFNSGTVPARYYVVEFGDQGKTPRPAKV